MRSLFCDNKCNKDLNFVYVHGYDFGDRLMEGVMFKVEVVDGKGVCVGLHPDSEPYMAQFNWEHWKKRCEEHCVNIDIAQCPHCGEDVLVEDEETAASRPEPVAINMASTKDILNDILKKE